MLHYVRQTQGIENYLLLRKFFINATYGVSIVGKIDIEMFITQMKSHIYKENHKVNQIWKLKNHTPKQKVFGIYYSTVENKNPNVLEKEIAQSYSNVHINRIKKDRREDIIKMFR